MKTLNGDHYGNLCEENRQTIGRNRRSTHAGEGNSWKVCEVPDPRKVFPEADNCSGKTNCNVFREALWATQCHASCHNGGYPAAGRAAGA